MDPTAAEAFYNLASCHLDQGNLPEAVLNYEKAIDAAEHPNLDSYLSLASALQLDLQNERATFVLNQARELFGDEPSILAALQGNF